MSLCCGKKQWGMRWRMGFESGHGINGISTWILLSLPMIEPADGKDDQMITRTSDDPNWRCGKCLVMIEATTRGYILTALVMIIRRTCGPKWRTVTTFWRSLWRTGDNLHNCVKTSHDILWLQLETCIAKVESYLSCRGLLFRTRRHVFSRK